MITISKAMLSGAVPDRIREQTQGLESGGLRDLAVKLAGDPDLRVSVITYADGRQELEVLHTGPPHHAEETIDSGWFAREAGLAQARSLPVAGAPDIQNAAALVRAILLGRRSVATWDATRAAVRRSVNAARPTGRCAAAAHAAPRAGCRARSRAAQAASPGRARSPW